jgi:hypothetical protein
LARCESCGHERIPEQQSGGPVEPPREGDFWLCPRCGEIHRFTGGLVFAHPLGSKPIQKVVRRCTEEELGQLSVFDHAALLRQREEVCRDE